jgi:hypothetical protein
VLNTTDNIQPPVTTESNLLCLLLFVCIPAGDAGGQGGGLMGNLQGMAHQGQQGGQGQGGMLGNLGHQAQSFMGNRQM